MSPLQSLILGLVQGITEFFPISSSAHLKIVKIFLDIKETPGDLLFDLICHLGTLCATLFFLRKEIFSLFTKERQKLFFLFLALIPLVPIYYFFHSYLASISQLSFLGFFWIFTSLLLFVSLSIEKKPSSNKIHDVLWIGTMQAFALIPGISRSGATISGACLRGWTLREAIRFSFLLSLPTIIGGSMLESFSLFYLKKTSLPNISFSSYLIGFSTALAAGFCAGSFIFSVTKKKKLLPFAWYCLAIGMFTLWYFFEPLGTFVK